MDTGAPTCPRCGRLSRPGQTCEWCGASLESGSPPTAPWLLAGSDTGTGDTLLTDSIQSPLPPMGAGEAFLRRLAAWVLDSFALSAIMYPLFFIVWFGFMVSMLGTANSQSNGQIGAMFGFVFFMWLLLSALMLAISIGYYGGMLSARGQTLGKMALGLKVVGPDGRNPSFWRAVLRELIGKPLSGFLLYLGFFWMLWDPEQQTWHDKIASTYVYRIGDEVPRPGAVRDRTAGAPNQGLVVARIIAAAIGALLLVVVPIMAAILFPVFSQAREKARTTACMSHMKQVGLGLSMYMEDYDGRLPLAKNWCDGVQPYEKDPLMFQCPSLPGVRGAQAYNGQLSAVPMNRILLPSETVAVFDGKGGWNLAGGPELADPRHENALNVLFVTGQVRRLRSLDNVVWKPSGERQPKRVPEAAAD